MAFRLEQQTGILIKKAARLFEQVSNKNLDELGVTYAQTIFLIRLWEKDGQSQAELAKSAGLKQPTAVRLLDRMERDGLVKRLNNKIDRRIFNFTLTAKAKKACLKLEKHANHMNEISNSRISKEKTDALNELILIVIGNLETYLDAK